MNTPTSAWAVDVHELSKHYGKLKALTNMNLQIPKGEVLGLLGHNGAGKSTLMKLILGVIRPTAGKITTLGHSPYDSNSHKYRQQFGYLPENVSFYEQLSGKEVLSYFAKLKGFSKAEAFRLLEEVGLSQAASRAVKTYSKGMRQRLGLAQALIGNPKLLVLDEPTVGLDPIATRDFYQTLDKLKSQGCSVILCTHVLQGVEQHIDRAMIMGGGQSLAIGNLDTLRTESQLPIEIKFNGSAANEIGDAFSHFKVTANSDCSQSVQLHVPQREKMSVVRHLSQSSNINDIEIHPPNLQDIYAHFMHKYELSRGNLVSDRSSANALSGKENTHG